MVLYILPQRLSKNLHSPNFRIIVLKFGLIDVKAASASAKEPQTNACGSLCSDILSADQVAQIGFALVGDFRAAYCAAQSHCGKGAACQRLLNRSGQPCIHGVGTHRCITAHTVRHAKLHMHLAPREFVAAGEKLHARYCIHILTCTTISSILNVLHGFFQGGTPPCALPEYKS